MTFLSFFILQQINIIILIVVAVQLYRTKRKFRRMTQTGYHIKDQEKNKQMIAKRRRKSVMLVSNNHCTPRTFCL